MDDGDLIVAFEAGTLDGANFRHERHVRVAWGLITRAWFELVADATELRVDSQLFDRTLLSRYYTPERLKAGRERWVEPDLCPLTPPAAPGAGG